MKDSTDEFLEVTTKVLLVSAIVILVIAAVVDGLRMLL